MRPLTDTKPKPLVEVYGRTLVDRVLDRLEGAGVRTVTVNVHHHADLLEKHLKTRVSPDIVISDERAKLLDSGGGVKKALAQLGQGPFFIVNSDTIWIEGMQRNLPMLAEAFDPERMDAVLLLAATAASRGYDGRGDFSADSDGRLIRRAEGRVTPFVYAGAMVTTAAFFDDAPDGPFSLNLLFDRAIANGRLYGIRLDGTWMHVGTPDAIAEAEACYAADQG
jgi:MurNAc alpha-1-phosphate uridylyltransferase